MSTAIIDEAAVKRQMLSLKPFLDSLPSGDVDALLTGAIAGAQDRFERELKTFFAPTKLKTFPLNTDVLGTDYDQEEAPYDFYEDALRIVSSYTLRYRPIISIQGIGLAYGPGDAKTLFKYPDDWVRPEKRLGLIRILPLTGFVSPNNIGILPVGNWNWLPRLVGSAINGVVPGVVFIDYTAGWASASMEPRLAGLRLRLAQEAAIQALPSLLEMVPTSVSRDGVSVSYQNAAKPIEARQAQVEAFLEEWREANTPIPMEIL